MFYIGARYVPLVLAAVAKWGVPGALSTSAFCPPSDSASPGCLTYLFELSFAFGAFMAGLVLSESDYGRALSDLIPVRDIFGLLFFVTIGMLLDPFFSSLEFGTVLGLCRGRLREGLILTAVTRLFGYGRGHSLAVFFGAFRVEIAFIVLGGPRCGAIGQEVYALSLNTAIVSMILGPGRLGADRSGLLLHAEAPGSLRRPLGESSRSRPQGSWSLPEARPSPTGWQKS